MATEGAAGAGAWPYAPCDPELPWAWQDCVGGMGDRLVFQYQSTVQAGVTAPSSPQLFDALYPEIIKWLDRLPPAWRDLWTVTSDHITLKSNPECFITARTSRSGDPGGAGGPALGQRHAGGG